MGVFDDKKFEELDWISQATEPMDSQLNVILGKLPDEVTIDYDMFKEFVGDNYSMSLDLSRAVAKLVRDHAEGSYLGWADRAAIVGCFEFQMDDEIVLDFENKTMSGEIKIIKVQNTMDEKILENMLGREGIDRLNQLNYMENGQLARANEAMELLGKCDNGLRTRSGNKKRQIIKQRLANIMKANEWKIKDTELANKVGTWLYNYICDGDLKAWSNFCRLKVMTHKDQAIYSMEEV